MNIVNMQWNASIVNIKTRLRLSVFQDLGRTSSPRRRRGVAASRPPVPLPPHSALLRSAPSTRRSACPPTGGAPYTQRLRRFDYLNRKDPRETVLLIFNDILIWYRDHCGRITA